MADIPFYRCTSVPHPTYGVDRGWLVGNGTGTMHVPVFDSRTGTVTDYQTAGTAYDYAYAQGAISPGMGGPSALAIGTLDKSATTLATVAPAAIYGPNATIWQDTPTFTWVTKRPHYDDTLVMVYGPRVLWGPDGYSDPADVQSWMEEIVGLSETQFRPDGFTGWVGTPSVYEVNVRLDYYGGYFACNTHYFVVGRQSPVFEAPPLRIKARNDGLASGVWMGHPTSVQRSLCQKGYR